MLKSILLFILGASLSGLVSFYYFTDQIESSNELKKLVVNNQIDYFKALHSEKALQIIKINNAYIQQSMSGSLTSDQIIASQALLASSLLLADITIQSIESKENTFLSMMVVYARTINAEEFKEKISDTASFCKKHTTIDDCSHEAMTTMYSKFKEMDFEPPK